MRKNSTDDQKKDRRGDVASAMFALVARRPGIDYFAALHVLKSAGYKVNTDGSGTLIGYYDRARKKVKATSRSEERRELLSKRKRKRRRRRRGRI